jgi:hypothetical protein
MAQHPHYPQGRLSSLTRAPDRPEQLGASGGVDHELVNRLRQIRDDGEESMAAIEEYDPNVCLNLSLCGTPEEARAMLETWLSRRVEVLQRVQTELRKEWERSRGSNRSGDPYELGHRP